MDVVGNFTETLISWKWASFRSITK